MNQLLQLIKRNCLVYLRDGGSVFFSLLSMLIVLGLMVIFLGNMNVNAVTELLAEYSDTLRNLEADRENAVHLIQYWTLAGILATNAVTVTLGAMTTMVKDAADKKLDSFYCAPVSGFMVAVSYISASVVLGMLLCIVPFAVAVIYFGAAGGGMLSAAAIIKLLGCMLLNVFIFSIIMYLIACLVKSVSAWTGIGTIVGTLVGFIGAIYLPMGQLPETVQTVLKYLPVLHGTSLMRKFCCEQTLAATFEGMPQEVIDGYNEVMGITIVMGDSVVGSGFSVGFLLICGMIALGLILVVMKSKKRA